MTLLFAACDSTDAGDRVSPAATAAPAQAATSTVIEATPVAAGEPLTITTAAGLMVPLHAEIAETREQRTQGLMGRSELAPDSGMLFAIEPPGRGFWMRGTTLPLTVAFVAECGLIVDFADLEPLSEEIKNTDRPYAFALEMERGWFAAHGIAVGDTLSLPDRLRPETC